MRIVGGRLRGLKLAEVGVGDPAAHLRPTTDRVREAVFNLLLNSHGFPIEGADLILVTGGTGPAPRDETPEALAEVIEKELPGFGEEMRRASLAEGVPTAILSRQTAGIRDACLMILLPGKPAAIATCLDAVFAAVPYCLDLIGAAWIETNPARIAAFRPKG